MAIDVTPWCAWGETVTPASHVLGVAVRRALPGRETAGTSDWAYGTRQGLPRTEVPNAKPVVRLERLAWRLRENLEVQQRTMGEWSFSGVGWVADRRVDFAGEYLRDFATGAFWEFRLKTIG